MKLKNGRLVRFAGKTILRAGVLILKAPDVFIFTFQSIEDYKSNSFYQQLHAASNNSQLEESASMEKDKNQQTETATFCPAASQVKSQVRIAML